MMVVYDFEKLRNTFMDFYNVTGINVNLIKTDLLFLNCNSLIHNKYCKAFQEAGGRRICHFSDMELLKRCRKSKKPETHICPVGLVDVAIPIIYDDIILGYIILGQFKQENNFDTVKQYLKNYISDTDEMKAYYDELPVLDDEKIQSIINLVTMLAKYILTENMVKTDLNKNIKEAVSYIDNNLDKKLTIDGISRSINISKSTIYRNFHSFLNCTVNEYMTLKRIEKSVDLLLNTDLSIEDITQKVGFESASYYSKVFKKHKGLSPLKYRKKGTF